MVRRHPRSPSRQPARRGSASAAAGEGTSSTSSWSATGWTSPRPCARWPGGPAWRCRSGRAREDAQRKRLRDALEAAISFYHQVLTSHASGAAARDYLHARGFTDDTISTYGLGWAPDAWDALSSALTRRRNIAEADLEGAGLVSRRRSGSGVYDRFRGRVIFPIRDASGGATGLAGRILGPQTSESGPKYLNSPQTLLFDKGRTLYLIDRAKGAIRRTGRAVLVEGNTDALMAHQAGFDNVVCSMGTALTAGQVELLTRYAPRIALAYDVDAAGQSAAAFGATELTALVGEIERSPYRGRLTDVDVVRLPEGKDPDEVIRDEPETWKAATEHPQPIMEFLIDRAAARHDQRTVPGRERLVAAVLPTLRTIADPVRRDGYVQLLARRSGVEERTLLEALRQSGSSGPGPAAAMRATPVRASTSKPSWPSRTRSTHAPWSAPWNRPRRPCCACSSPTPARWPPLPPASMRRHLRDDAGARALEGAPAPPWVLARTTPSTASPSWPDWSRPWPGVARTLLARTDPLPASTVEMQQAIDQSLLTLDRARLSERIEFTRARLAEAEASRDAGELETLQQEVLELQQRRLALDRAVADTSLLSRRRIHPKPTTEHMEVTHGDGRH